MCNFLKENEPHLNHALALALALNLNLNLALALNLNLNLDLVLALNLSVNFFWFIRPIGALGPKCRPCRSFGSTPLSTPRSVAGAMISAGLRIKR